MQFPKRQLPKSVLATNPLLLGAVVLGHHCSLRRIRRPDPGIVKLPIEKLHIWEVATWEIVTLENVFGKIPNTF